MLILLAALAITKPSPAAPEKNPHPPQTAAEKADVAFAEDVVKAWLLEPKPSPPPDIARFYEQVGSLTEYKHLHVVPPKKGDDATPTTEHTLAPNERAVHFYGRTNRGGGWYDLSVILAEEDGERVMKHLVFAPLGGHHKMPPGAKC